MKAPRLEHLHIYKWREDSQTLTCDCGKPCPTKSKVVWK